MKIVLLARSGPAAYLIASTLSRHWPIKILAESGRAARWRKLRRYFDPGDIWRWPIRVLDVLAIFLYNRRMGQTLSTLTPKLEFPENRETVFCDDANDAIATRQLREWKPDLVIVYGTAVLNKQTLQLAPCFLNLHGGIVPKYRNVHSEFWAIDRAEPQQIGTSVIYLDLGIDTGDVALQEVIPYSESISVRRAVFGNVQLAAKLAVKAVQLFERNQLPRQPQAQMPVAPVARRTPGVFDMLRIWRAGKF